MIPFRQSHMCKLLTSFYKQKVTFIKILVNFVFWPILHCEANSPST